jgi:hypothetical protein
LSKDLTMGGFLCLAVFAVAVEGGAALAGTAGINKAYPDARKSLLYGSFSLSSAPVRAEPSDAPRQLFTVTFPPETEPAVVPVRFVHSLTRPGVALTEVDADGRPTRTSPATFVQEGEAVALIATQPAGRQRVFWLEARDNPNYQPEVRLEERFHVIARTYEARVDPARGGVLASLAWWSPDGRRVETLGPGGMQWNWTGSPGKADQPSQGAVPIEILESGPVRVVLRTTARDVLGAGNTFTVTSTFYPDGVDLHYEFHHETTFQTSALKLWCFLSPQRYRPGFKAGHTTGRTPLLQSGKPVWTPDPLFVDMTFDDPDGFGLGFIHLNRLGSVYMEDAAGGSDTNNLFLDATGYNGQMQDVTADVDEWIRLVPHGPGPDAWRVSRTFAVPPQVRALGIQPPGGPRPDTDADGLDDLAELRARTNPLAADTDGDGLPDGRDPQPLRHAHPEEAMVPPPLPPPSQGGERENPLAPPTPTVRPQANAEVRDHRGAPTIFVNGRPFGPITFTLPGDYTVDYLKPFAAADLRIVSIYTDGGFSRPGDEGLAHLDQQMKVVLEANPGAYVFVRPMYIETPEAWAQHPTELFTFFDGTARIKDGGPAKGNEGQPHYTFASEVWKADVGRALRRLVDHVRQSWYSDRVIGYFLGAGYPTEEWIYPGWGPDYSPAMAAAFRRFLIRRYRGSVAALRAAWNDAEADFATAAPPPPEEWQAPNAGDFWNPDRGTRVADYFRCHNETEAEKVEYLSRVVKAATGGQALCGFWYLNLACISHHFSGHQALEKMLGCPTIDLFGAPSPYENRDLGSDAPLRSVTESVRLHGKVWYSNTDTRTHFAEASQDQFGRPSDMAGTLSILTRDFASLVTRGVQGEWYEMGSWYHDPQIYDLMRRLQFIGRLSLRFPRSLPGGLAVIVDEDSLFQTSGTLNFECLERLRTNELSRLGVPVDFYFLDDLAHPNTPRYRCYLFLNAFALSSARRALVRRTVDRPGTTAVWLYAPGLLRPDRPPALSADGMEELTGLCLRFQEERRVLAMRPVGPHPLLDGWPPDRILGQWEFQIRCNFGVFPNQPVDPGPVAHSPVVYADDPEATVLARYADGGEPSFCVKEAAGRKTVWFGSPAISSDLLRRILQWSGVHVYDDSNDVIYLSPNLLAVHAAHDPPQVVRFPTAVDVYDLLREEMVAQRITEVHLNLPRLGTGLYFYGDLKTLRRELAQVRTDR